MALKLHRLRYMLNGRVVVLGNPSAVETHAFEKLAPEFGWSVEVAHDLSQLSEFSAAANVVAVFFEANKLGLPWEDALRLVREAAPQALLVPCHRLSEFVNWPELVDAGAFHAVALPLKPEELRQSLSFVWSARLKRTAKLVAMPRPETRRLTCKCGENPCQCVPRGAMSAGSVA